MGCRFTHHPDHSVVVDVPKHVENLLHSVGMQDANPVATPMAKGFVVSLQDAPTVGDAEQAVVAHANKNFNTDCRQLGNAPTSRRPARIWSAASAGSRVESAPSHCTPTACCAG